MVRSTIQKRNMSLLNADSGSQATSGYHKINLAITALTPLAFALSPSPLSMPIDILMGLALPIHAHIGMNYVITDYVPKLSKGAVGPARIFMLGLTGVTILGCAKINFMGPGLTETVKGLWRGSPKAVGGGGGQHAQGHEGSYGGVKARATEAAKKGQATHAQVQRRMTKSNK